MSDEKRYDVVIYNDKTRQIESMAGQDMRLDAGFHNAEKRAETAWSRINDAYSVAIIDAGKFTKGDKLPKGVTTY